MGGIKPFLATNPAFDKVDSIAIAQTAFILKLAEIQPKLEFHNLKTESLGNGLTRVTVDLYNNSPLPTHSEMGTRSRWLRKIRIDLDASADKIVSGDKIKLVDSVDAFGKETFSWIVRGTGSVTIKAGAAHAGFATQTVKL